MNLAQINKYLQKNVNMNTINKYIIFIGRYDLYMTIA